MPPMRRNRPMLVSIVAAALAPTSLGAAVAFKQRYWAIRSAVSPAQPGWDGTGPGGGWAGLTGLAFMVFAGCLVALACALATLWRRRGHTARSGAGLS